MEHGQVMFVGQDDISSEALTWFCMLLSSFVHIIMFLATSCSDTYLIYFSVRAMESNICISGQGESYSWEARKKSIDGRRFGRWIVRETWGWFPTLLFLERFWTLGVYTYIYIHFSICMLWLWQFMSEILFCLPSGWTWKFHYDGALAPGWSTDQLCDS